MTENKRQEMLKDIQGGYIDAWDNLAIEELFEDIEKEHSEIQQYRELGTVEELRSIKASMQLLTDIVSEYSSIGTIELFRVLKNSEHNYDNCRNITCRRKCQKDGYNDAINDIKKRFRADYDEMLSVDMEDCINWADSLDAIAEQLRGDRE